MELVRDIGREAGPAASPTPSFEIVGASPALLAVLARAAQVAPTDATVLIRGETGTGKELVAHAIHAGSERAGRPFVRVNCGAISAGLVESELFGHVKGAFTGAVERRIGRFELADGGTILLDEVGELPLETQVKLLRVLQEREFEPVGRSRSQRADVRVIAATNRDLEEAVRAGRFRADLFYRLNVFPIELPALRERRTDIARLAAFYVAHYARRLRREITAIAPEAMHRLERYDWPGNVRELQNVLERAVILCRGPTLDLDPDLLPIDAAAAGSAPVGSAPADFAPDRRAAAPSGFATLREVERDHILAALRHARGVIEGPNGAARMLNLHPNTLRHRMSKLGIRRDPRRAS
jgi:formate hydrogenlyase transcriptional activator